MKCKFKFGNGKNCKYTAGKESKFCYVHDPSLLPLFFIGNVGKYKKNDFEPNLPIEKAKAYIDDGFAIQISYAFRVKWEKTLVRLLDGVLKRMSSDVKGYIADNDKASLVAFFTGKAGYDAKKASKFINDKSFNTKERAYLKTLIKSIKS